jgi:hypothetical protein
MTQWNMRYTKIIRNSRPNLWGNWALDSHIKPGAVGIVDPSSGEFKLVHEQMPGCEVLDKSLSGTWKMESTGVTRHETTGKASVAVTDPQTGLQLNPELEVKWTLKKEDSLASQFALCRESVIRDMAAIKGQFMWLYQQAANVGMAHDGRIAQGFGVVTHALFASSGLNIGAKDKDSSYTVGGTLKGMQALLGEGGPGGNSQANYSYAVQTKSLDTHVWPQQANTSTNLELPVAYGFTSFAGELLIPVWVGKVNSLVINLDSKFRSGTSYITKATLSYHTEKGRHHEEATIMGGSSKSFANIPLQATDLEVKIVFVGLVNDDTHVLRWATPLSQWLHGVRNIDLTGTWPGQTRVEVLEEPNRNR